ncbi:MAG: DNA repair protein RecO [Desulfobacterales bacterium]|nr:DNA repair protein RecO [Desulfobacterales bacterium]
MSSYSTSAIILKRIDYGDYDLILSLITKEQGKISAIAKYAKKSKKRFGGTLEHFSILNVTLKKGRENSLSILEEALLIKCFSNVRSDMVKTAYAFYWTEILNSWIKEGEKNEQVYELLNNTLVELNNGKISSDLMNIFFHIRFLTLSGFLPELNSCGVCKRNVKYFQNNNICFNIKDGFVVCESCKNNSSGSYLISKGIINMLLWINRDDFLRLSRINLTLSDMKNITGFLESFSIYHIGKEPKSLDFLKNIRNY